MVETKDLIARKSELMKKLLPLEWDKRLNQLHYAREMEMAAYKKELEAIELQIGGNNV